MKCPACKGKTHRMWKDGKPARCEQCIQKELDECEKKEKEGKP